MPMDLYQKAAEKIQAIEDELKALGRWQQEALPETAFENMGAFGANKMSFEQWLQFVLVPRVKEIIKEHGEFPSGSMVGTYSIREFDGDPEVGKLQQLLYEFDALFN